MPDNPHFYTVHDEHPDHGGFEAVFRVHSDGTRFTLEPGRSTFPTTNSGRRAECVERAVEAVHDEFGEAVTVTYDEEDL
ncbi:hypothetical protein ACFO0N_16115 [Halobium salinum]|uniref:DUF2188 domain-containing protein n=1 Tax=Halobium salinum TaxID=1364940 RepID=A0ABD5PF49_9EURY|nr:hypothetical protein [Halobium salinum]